LSQAGLIDVEKSNPQIPTSFDTDSGTAIPLVNVLEVLGNTVANGTNAKPLFTKGSGNTVTAEIQVGAAITGAPADTSNAGIASFEGTQFLVDAKGHVKLLGGGAAIDSFTTDISGPVTPTGLGVVDVTGTSVFSNGSVANTLTLNVQATAQTFLLGAGSGTTATEIGPLINGELIIGSTGNAPVLATLTGGPGVTITNGVGSITINSVLYTDQGSGVTVVSDSGSFSTAAITLTLPASPNNGERCEFIAASGVLVIQLAGTQVGHLAGASTSAGGTFTGSATGDSIVLIYQSSTDDWWALGSPSGVWVLA
jgi:hypothetical protein